MNLYKSHILIVGVIVVVSFASIAAAVLFMMKSGGDGTSPDVTTSSDAEKGDVPPLALKPYSSKEAGFSMDVPGESDIDVSADEVFEGGYTVSGGSNNEEYGNRLFSVKREVYDFGSTELSYEQYKRSMDDFVQSEIDVTSDGEMRVLSKKDRTLSGHPAYEMRLKETVPSKKQNGKLFEYAYTYVFVYIDSKTSYMLDFKSRADDAAFWSVVDDMINSFKVI